MIELNKIYNADCMDIMKSIPDKSIDLILTDPPYYKIMITDHKGNKHKWDNGWETLEDYLIWMKNIFKEFSRILKSNGSLYVFADDKISAYLQIELEKLNFYFENNITWVKPNNMTIKGWNSYRCFAPITERILFFSKESRNTNLENESYFENIKIFSPLINYMIGEKKKVKEYFNFRTDKEFNDYINKVTDTSSVVSRHYFTYSQWVFPTKEIWRKLQLINNEVFKKEYEVFKKEYEDKRRTFNVDRNYTDVWQNNITSSGINTIHPTQKPLSIISRIIKISSNENDLVLDCFSGSGTTAIACIDLNRNFICIEKDKEYFEKSVERVNKELIKIKLF